MIGWARGRACLSYGRALAHPCSWTLGNNTCNILRHASTEANTMEAKSSASVLPDHLHADSHVTSTPPANEGSSFVHDLAADPNVSAAAASTSSLAQAVGPALGAIQAGLESIHAATGLPWWATIATTTVAVRTSLFPFSVVQARHAERLMRARPELGTLRQHLQARLSEVSRRHGVRESERASLCPKPSCKGKVK